MFGLCSCMIKLCQPSPAKLDCFCCILTLHYFTWLIIVLFVIMEKCSLWCCSQGMWRGVCKSKWRCSTFQLFEMFAFKKKRKKKGCGIFVSPLLFLSLFFLKNTFKGGGNDDDDDDIMSQPESCESNVAVGSRTSALSALSALLQYFVTSYWSTISHVTLDCGIFVSLLCTP